MLSINEDERAVTKGPTEHVGHSDFPLVRIAVLRTIKKMKVEDFNDTVKSLREIYNRNVKSLTDAKFTLSDIQAPTIGGLLPFPRFRGTLALIRSKSMELLRLYRA